MLSWIRRLAWSISAVYSVGLKIDYETIGIAAGFRLGAPVVRPTCASAKQRLQLMAIMVYLTVVFLVVTAATTSSTIYCVALWQTHAPWRRVSHIHSLCTSGGKRPDGVKFHSQVPWKRGRYLVWDTTSPNTFAQSYILDSKQYTGWVCSVGGRTKYRQVFGHHCCRRLCSLRRHCYSWMRWWWMTDYRLQTKVDMIDERRTFWV